MKYLIPLLCAVVFVGCQNRDSESSTVSDEVLTQIRLGMNPDFIKSLLGPPYEVGEVNLDFPDGEQWETSAWFYFFDDMRIRFLVHQNYLVAYTYEVYPTDNENRKARKIRIDTYCNDVVLGQSTFKEFGEGGRREYLAQLGFGNYRSPILLAKYVYPSVCRDAGTAFFSSGNYVNYTHDYDQWGDNIYTDIEESWAENNVVYSVTHSVNQANSPRLGFILKPWR